MNKQFCFVLISVFFLAQSCGNSNDKVAASKDQTLRDEIQISEETATELNYKSPSEQIPENYSLFEKIVGDVNKDGLKDSIFIIKKTNPKNIIDDENRGKLDRNRRGILIFINKKDHFELASQNLSCFSSENEDGGVYYAPELSVGIRKGNVYIEYSHGRYGYWNYTFRLKDADFELIGYDSSNNFGPVIMRETSINFLTKKKQVRTNINEEADSGDEIFEEKWSDIKTNKLILLSEIKDFDVLDLSDVK